MRLTLAIAALAGLALTVLGALGAHAVSPSSADLKASWDSALLFGFVHTLAAIAGGVLADRYPLSRYASWAFLAGVVLFSFTIMASVLARAGGDEAQSALLAGLTVVTPVGGVAFMLGWVILAGAALRGRG